MMLSMRDVLEGEEVPAVALRRFETVQEHILGDIVRQAQGKKEEMKTITDSYHNHQQQQQHTGVGGGAGPELEAVESLAAELSPLRSISNSVMSLYDHLPLSERGRAVINGDARHSRRRRNDAHLANLRRPHQNFTAQDAAKIFNKWIFRRGAAESSACNLVRHHKANGRISYELAQTFVVTAYQSAVGGENDACVERGRRLVKGSLGGFMNRGPLRPDLIYEREIQLNGRGERDRLMIYPQPPTDCSMIRVRFEDDAVQMSRGEAESLRSQTAERIDAVESVGVTALASAGIPVLFSEFRRLDTSRAPFDDPLIPFSSPTLITYLSQQLHFEMNLESGNTEMEKVVTAIAASFAARCKESMKKMQLFTVEHIDTLRRDRSAMWPLWTDATLGVTQTLMLGDRTRSTKRRETDRLFDSVDADGHELVELCENGGTMDDRMALAYKAKRPVMLNLEHYKRLKVRYLRRLNHEDTPEHEERIGRHRMLTRMFVMLLRYEALLLHNSCAGMQGAVPHAAFDVLARDFGVHCECFASPLNAYLPQYCSIFEDTDAHFGSNGSFFKFMPEEGSFEVNPPFGGLSSEHVILHVLRILCASRRGGERGERTEFSGPLSFVIVVSIGLGQEMEQKVHCSLRDLLGHVKDLTRSQLEGRGTQFLVDAVTFEKDQHVYIRGTQYKQDSNKATWTSMIHSKILFLQNEPGRHQWPVTPEKIESLRRSFTSCQMNATAGVNGSGSGGGGGRGGGNSSSSSSSSSSSGFGFGRGGGAYGGTIPRKKPRR